MELRVVLVALLAVSTPIEAAFIDRGSGLIYDDVLDVTWLQDANFAATNTFGVAGIDADGRMTWDTAMSWVSAMSASSYLGQDSWRLPSATSPTLCTGTCGELGSLWLSLYGATDTPGPDSAPFFNFVLDYYWTGTTYDGNPDGAWYFNGTEGRQYPGAIKSNTFHVWALLDGDVCSPFPGGGATGGCFPGPGPFPASEPGTLALLGLGLAGLGLRRRRKAA